MAGGRSSSRVGDMQHDRAPLGPVNENNENADPAAITSSGKEPATAASPPTAAPAAPAVPSMSAVKSYVLQQLANREHKYEYQVNHKVKGTKDATCQRGYLRLQHSKRFRTLTLGPDFQPRLFPPT